MQVNLVGVLVDGPDRAPGVPDNPRASLSWPVGTDVTLRLQIVSRSSGQPVDLTPAGTKVELVVRASPQPLALPALLDVFGAPPVPSVPGVMIFAITSAMQQQISYQGQVGKLFYDVWLTRGTGGPRDPVVPTSPLYLESAVSKVGGG